MAIPLTLATADTPEPWQAVQAEPLAYARAGLPTAPRRSLPRMIGATIWWGIRSLARVVWLGVWLVSWALSRLLWLAAHAVRFVLLCLAKLVESLPTLLTLPVRLVRRLLPERVPYAKLV